jgi:acyl-coenzyme A synthetase/AMP-(fatty) acid ligase
MDSTIFPVERVDPGWTSVPYGRPMANQRVYVLDRHRQPVPVGIPGELYLAGTGLARGYLNRPELTAERFVSHTFHDGRTERLYQTGDMARYELLGRRDFQVKIYGLRIELGEIEAVLRRHEAVANAVVVAAGARGRTRLVAFVTRSGERGVGDQELRRWLGELLPPHMVPRTITTLDRLPTTPNGKVDRRALMSAGVKRDAAAAETVDALESRIVRAWREVLGVDDIGLDDNFLDLGGDSVAAIRVMQALDESRSVVALLENPTVRELAALLRPAVQR